MYRAMGAPDSCRAPGGGARRQTMSSRQRTFAGSPPRSPAGAVRRRQPARCLQTTSTGAAKIARGRRPTAVTSRARLVLTTALTRGWSGKRKWSRRESNPRPLECHAAQAGPDVLDRAQACEKVGAPLLPRMCSRTVAHRATRHRTAPGWDARRATTFDDTMLVTTIDGRCRQVVVVL